MAEHRNTFLFTDIEGSTRLWSRAPAVMTAVVPRQEALLRQIVEEHEGAIFKTVGDGVYAVFSHAPDAVRAAVAAQRELLAQDRDRRAETDPIRVRIGLHTGPAEQRENDYFGATLNRLSRTLAAGHGGQILCTDDTVASCRDDWPAGIATRDLGARSLRDVPGSGRIFQLVADGLPEHFPPLTTLDPRMHNLPRWSSPIVGRVAEQERLRQMLRSHAFRLVSVLGTGGVGKTRLATDVSAQLLDEFQDGIRFVDLAPLRDGAHVAPAIAQVAGASDPLLSPLEALLDWLQRRETLLVLDNCEQVVDGVADVCGDILARAPGVTILITSRVPIRVRGEHRLSLEPLPLPDTDMATADRNPAVQLFVERAREVDEAFALDASNTMATTGICRLVDGLPLAIELAAAWVRLLSPDALHRRLQDGRAMLRDGARDLPGRQRTLAATIGWSYELLEPEDRRAFRRLAVFRGGIAVDAAAAVIWEAPIDDPLWALSRLDALVQANLLHVGPDLAGEPRFLMLQTIQEFAARALREAGEWDDASMAHAAFFANLMEDATAVAGTSDAAPLFDRLERDMLELEPMMTTLLATSDGATALQVALNAWTFLDPRNRHGTGHDWIERALAAAPDAPAPMRFAALQTLGDSSTVSLQESLRSFHAALALARESGDIEKIAAVSLRLAQISSLTGDDAEALRAAQENVELARQVPDPALLFNALYFLSDIAERAGEFERALQTIGETRALDPPPWVIACTLLTEGRIACFRGRDAEAVTMLREAQQLFDTHGDIVSAIYCELELSGLVDRIGVDAAVEHLQHATGAILHDGQVFALILLFYSGALLAHNLGDAAHAATWLSTALALCHTFGVVPNTSRKPVIDTILQSAEERLGSAVFTQRISESASTSPRDVQASFLQWLQQIAPTSGNPPAPD